MKSRIYKSDDFESKADFYLRDQNTEYPLLDILVRESIQNSADAAAFDSKPVIFEILTKDIIPSDLSSHFPELSDYFSTTDRKKSIIIADANTNGLTGRIRRSEPESKTISDNYLGLVAGVTESYKRPDSGGSWGLGKIIFSLLGIGLVIYYSRIRKTNGSFEERLAATLFENTDESDTLIHQTNYRGIAMWGAEDPENPGKIIPLIDDDRDIDDILRIFSVERYTGNLTGTMIIVPCINEEKLLHQIKESVPENSTAPWCNSIENYMEIAIQRWYAPRLSNHEYPGPYILARINGKSVPDESGMEPVFNLIQDLYNQSLTEKENTKNDTVLFSNILTQNYDSGSNFKIGSLVWTKVTKTQLTRPGTVSFYNPYLLFCDDKDYSYSVENQKNPPIVIYMRKPGMVITYVDKNWTRGLQDTDPDCFLIGLFRLESDAELRYEKENKTHDVVSIKAEKYVRKNEKGDHFIWKDDVSVGRVRFVTNMSGKVIEKIKNAAGKQDMSVSNTRKLSIGRKIGNAFLPSNGFYLSRDKKKQTQTGYGGGSKGPVITENVFENKGTSVWSKIIVDTKGNDKTMILLVLNAENGTVSAKTWEGEKGIKTKFPICFKDITLKSIIGVNQSIEKTISSFSDRIMSDGVMISPISTFGNQITGFRINTPRSAMKLVFEFTVSVPDDTKLCPSISISTYSPKEGAE